MKTIEKPERRITLPPLPEIDDITRRDFLKGSAGLLVLGAAGCGGQEDEGGEESGETRTIEHVSGTTEVPLRPERVVSTTWGQTTNLVLLGITPVAGPEIIVEYLAPYRDYLPDGVEPEDIRIVGDTYEPNFEALAAADPQVILAYDFQEDLYEDFSSIAPTVMFEFGTQGEWRTRFDRDAGAVGRAEEARTLEADYEEAVNSLSGFTGMSVSFIRLGSEGVFDIYGPTSFPGSVMADVEVPFVEAPEGVGEDSGVGFVSNVSGERLSVVTGDVIVVPDYSALYEQDPDLAEFERNPLWETLPAVQAGRVVSVPASVFDGQNYAAAQMLIEAIADALR